MVSVVRGHFYSKKRGGDVGASTAPKTRALRPPRNSAMILFVELNLKQINRHGEKYRWPRPARCRCGNTRLWGHGFVDMLFDGFLRPLKMRRYRCRVCRCVIRLRPVGYFSRHQSSTATIRRVLAKRIATGRWPAGCAVNRARHWLKALKANALAVLGVGGYRDLRAAFDRLIVLGWIPVRRSV